jgi:hypothetical protein
MSPAVPLKHIFTLVEGTANIADERQQRLLLQSIAELARKGLQQLPWQMANADITAKTGQ